MTYRRRKTDSTIFIFLYFSCLFSSESLRLEAPPVSLPFLIVRNERGRIIAFVDNKCDRASLSFFMCNAVGVNLLRLEFAWF